MLPLLGFAWAQAILSGVAIYFAGRIAVQQHRREIGQRVGSVVALLARVADQADFFSEDVDHLVGDIRAHFWDLEPIERASKALSNVSVHELADEGFVMPVLDAADSAKALTEALKKAKDVAHSNYPMQQYQADDIKMLVEKVSKAYNEAVEVDRRHRPLTRKQRKAIRSALSQR